MTSIEELEKASDSELIAMIGLLSLPLLEDPSDLLSQARTGKLSVTPAAVMGSSGQFESKSFESKGRRFFAIWGDEFRKAICQNSKLSGDLRKQSLTQLGVGVGLVTAAVTSAMPSLAPFSGLLTVVGIFIVRSGVESFCRFLTETNTADTSTGAHAPSPTKGTTRTRAKTPRKSR